MEYHKIKVRYEKIKGKYLCAASEIPDFYREEFLEFSFPTLKKNGMEYHSLARTRRFLKSRRIEFDLEEIVK